MHNLSGVSCSLHIEIEKKRILVEEVDVKILFFFKKKVYFWMFGKYFDNCSLVSN